MSFVEALAARVKARREELGLSQRQVPGVGQSVVSRVERGEIADPALSTIEGLAAGLRMSVDELRGVGASGVRMIALRDLHGDPFNPRAVPASKDEDEALRLSIERSGLLQPLAVRRHSYENGPPLWHVVDGHRRLAALHGVHGADSETLIPCRVVELTDENVRLMAQLTANMQRADFNPWDLAAAIAQLVEQGEDTAIIAMATGRKRRWVQEQASIGKWLVEPARQWLKDGKLSISQAVALAAVRDPKEQSQLAHRAITEAMSEDAIREATAARKARKAAGDDDDEGEAVEAPKPKRKHQKARKVQAAPPSLDELRKPPAWAAGIVKARFVVVDATGATARLVKGWAAMVEAAHPADEEATALVLQADTWVADSEGVAFAHACGAYRLTDE